MRAPPELKLDWQLLGKGKTRDGTAFSHYRASFTTPCTSRIYDALPVESRTAHVQLLVPNHLPTSSSSLPPSPTASSCVMLLAATGDQGFKRRMALGSPLLKHGVSVLALESPFYGLRKPKDQIGSKLNVVSDLLVLGFTTIFESICLLNTIRPDYEKLCISGLSMGGVHAAMTAGIYQSDVSCVPLLAPRSAAVAYCDGAMRTAMAWPALDTELDSMQRNIVEVLRDASSSHDIISEARYAVQEIEGLLSSPEAASLAEMSQDAGQLPKDSSVNISRRTMMVRSLTNSMLSILGTLEKRMRMMRRRRDHQIPGLPMRVVSSQAPTTDGDNSSLGSAKPPPLLSNLDPLALPLGRDHSPPRPSHPQPAIEIGSAAGDSSWLANRIKDLKARDMSLVSSRTVSKLKGVLETFTDVTRYPPPKRADASILVCATHDAYVSVEGVQAVNKHWGRSELRLVSGGHVSAFLMHKRIFREAILDGISRL